MERKLVTIAVDGSAEFTTLTAAAAAQDPAQPLHFVLGAGTYYERPFLELADYIITGAGMGQTVISAGAAGRDPWPGEERTGTFRSQTLFLGGGSARLEHLTVENTAGDGADRGQALAVYADANRVCMVDVSLHGNQDTLFTAPLPLAVRQKNGFRGPRENTPRLDTKQYYRDCEISGNIVAVFFFLVSDFFEVGLDVLQPVNDGLQILSANLIHIIFSLLYRLSVCIIKEVGAAAPSAAPLLRNYCSVGLP